MHSKKILIYGENWEGTLPNLLYTLLLKKDYQTKIFDFTDILPGIKERSMLGRVKRRFLESRYAKEINQQFLHNVKQWTPELVLVSKGLHLSRDVLHQIREYGVFLVNWNPDDYLNMKNSSEKLIASMPDYDLIVSPREHRFPRYKELGANKLLWIDWYYVKGLHQYEPYEKKFEASFVGSWSPNREKFISQLNVQFHIWGGGWEKTASSFRKSHKVYKKILSQREMVKVFASSKFNLNMLTKENNDVTNLRMFEVTASGGLLLTEFNQSVLKYLEDGKEALMYSSAEDVNRLISLQIDFDRIALAGMKRITNDGNSFNDRVAVLLKAVERV
jgi:spore maturation protein CgeB